MRRILLRGRLWSEAASPVAVIDDMDGDGVDEVLIGLIAHDLDDGKHT